MANSIELWTQVASMLDEVYKTSACTTVLDGNNAVTRAGANAHTIQIPKISMDGLGDYSRNSGYVEGSVTATLETVAFNFERGRKFNIDDVDDEEFGGLLLANMASEFLRTKVAPEIDAFRFAQYASASGISELAAETFTSGADILDALNTMQAEMTDDEVPTDMRYLFITPTCYKLANSVATTVDKAVLDEFAGLVQVPSGRFFTAITQLDGTTEGETAGGFEQAPNSAKINFMIVHAPAVIQYEKRSIAQPISSAMNPDADGTIYKFREYGLADTYDNKAAGIYLSAQPDES